MADIDFQTDLRDTFTISISDHPQPVTGNRALVNRFEITFLTKTRVYLFGDKTVVDGYGGNADRYLNRPQVLSNIQSIGAAIQACIDATVRSIEEDTPNGLPDTEKLSRAELMSLNIQNDIINAVIRVYPVEIQDFNALDFTLPIVRT
jgi:hypothetical protein